MVLDDREQQPGSSAVSLGIQMVKLSLLLPLCPVTSQRAFSWSLAPNCHGPEPNLASVMVFLKALLHNKYNTQRRWDMCCTLNRIFFLIVQKYSGKSTVHALCSLFICRAAMLLNTFMDTNQVTHLSIILYLVANMGPHTLNLHHNKVHLTQKSRFVTTISYKCIFVPGGVAGRLLPRHHEGTTQTFKTSRPV